MNEERIISGSICGYVLSYVLCNKFKNTALYYPWKKVFNHSTHQLLVDWNW